MYTETVVHSIMFSQISHRTDFVSQKWELPENILVLILGEKGHKIASNKAQKVETTSSVSSGVRLSH
jgi:hypothetical protein